MLVTSLTVWLVRCHGLHCLSNYKFEGFDILGEYFNGVGCCGDAAGYSLRVAYKFDKFEPVFRYSHLKNDTFVIDADN